MTTNTATPQRTARLSDLRNLPPTLTLPVAGRIGWGLARATAYQLHQQGEFPCPVVVIGARFYVRTADLARALGIDPTALLDDRVESEGAAT